MGAPRGPSGTSAQARNPLRSSSYVAASYKGAPLILRGPQRQRRRQLRGEGRFACFPPACLFYPGSWAVPGAGARTSPHFAGALERRWERGRGPHLHPSPERSREGVGNDEVVDSEGDAGILRIGLGWRKYAGASVFTRSPVLALGKGCCICLLPSPGSQRVDERFI